MLDLVGRVPNDNVHVLHNGVDHILDEPAQRPVPFPTESKGTVVLFGSSKPYKNNRVIFNAFADKRLQKHVLVVVGSSRAALNQAGLQPPASTIFVGKCDDPTLRGLYEGAHCLVYPSRMEGFGLPPLEAMLCGCPAVVSPGGAIPEVCRDAVVYADVDDPRSWVDAILALSAPELRREKIEAGRKRATLFSWRRAGSLLFKHIQDVAKD